MNKTLPGIALISLILFSACQKHNSAPSTPPPPPARYVYVGGLVTGVNNNPQGVYWKINLKDNSVTGPTVVPNASFITCITLSDTNVYMAGNSTNAVGVYWKNGQSIHVPAASQINYVAASGGNIYTEGFDSLYGLAYWVNSTETRMLANLPNVSMSYAASGILAVNGNVYAIANISFWPTQENLVRYGSAAVEWVNGKSTILNQGGFGGEYFHNIPGIAASGTDVYFASNYDQGDTAGWTGYWKDTSLMKLYTNIHIQPSVYAWSNAITVAGSDVYLCGVAYNTNNSGALQAVYWKNSTMNYLPNGSQAYAVAVSSGSDVYVTGSDNSGNAVVWKNGTFAVTLPGRQPAVNCITSQ